MLIDVSMVSIHYFSGPLKGGLLVLRKSVIVVDGTQ
jgi:hypothetical protein